MEAGGIEPPSPCSQTLVSKGLTTIGPTRLVDFLGFLREHQPDLAAVVSAWPKLPDALRAGILAMMRAFQEGTAGE